MSDDQAAQTAIVLKNSISQTKGDEKIIPIPNAAAPPKRDVHKDVKPVKMTAKLLTTCLSGKREAMICSMSDEGAGLIRQIGEVDYAGNPARQALNAWHAIAEFRPLTKETGEISLKAQIEIAVESERLRHFSYLAGIELE